MQIWYIRDETKNGISCQQNPEICKEPQRARKCEGNSAPQQHEVSEKT